VQNVDTIQANTSYENSIVSIQIFGYETTIQIQMKGRKNKGKTNKYICEIRYDNKMKNQKCPTVGSIPESNIKIVERGKIDTPNVLWCVCFVLLVPMLPASLDYPFLMIAPSVSLTFIYTNLTAQFLAVGR